MIPYGRQSISQADIDAVTAVLRSDHLTQGPAVPAFESKVAQTVGAAHGVAVNSATSALHIACAALGLGPGDVLWTSPNTFVASANCARYCGADVDFVDINPVTLNMCPLALERKLRKAEIAGRLPKIVIPVHFAGEPCDMAAIHRLARTYGFSVIEDASHAVGARCGATAVGACEFSDVTIFSFHPVKIVTTAEGGLALTNRAELAERMALWRSHGITRAPELMISEPDGPWYYEQLTLGFNYRMTDLQAALGTSQLDRLAEFIDARQRLAARYDGLLADLPVGLPHRSTSNHSALHLYPVRVASGRRAVTFTQLRAQGIGVNVHYIPVHLQPYYRALGFKPGDFPEAERYYAEAISLPLFPALTEAEQDVVVQELTATLERQ